MQRYTRTFTAHLCTLNGLKTNNAMQNNRPVCYSLSQDEKNCSVYTSKERCNFYLKMHQKLAAGLYNAPPYPLTRFKG